MAGVGVSRAPPLGGIVSHLEDRGKNLPWKGLQLSFPIHTAAKTELIAMGNKEIASLYMLSIQYIAFLSLLRQPEGSYIYFIFYNHGIGKEVVH